MPRAKIALAALGGTLSMRSQHPDEGIAPSLDGNALLNLVPELASLAQVDVETLSMLPSASLDFDLLLRVLRWANRQIENGAQGVVITQGTDTLEETATFFDYLWGHDEPLIVTGAMRSAEHIGADGPANLLDACRVAISSLSRQRGVLVVMNAEIHEALAVRKTHSLALHAFASPNVGPAGEVIENHVRYLRPASPRHVLPWPARTDQRVALLEATLSADTLLLGQLLPLGYEGLVVAGFGAGHVSESWSKALASIAAQIPVILSTRTGTGPTTSSTYGFIGSEMDLLRRGLLASGYLCPRKARVLLWLLIGAGRQSELASFLQA